MPGGRRLPPGRHAFTLEAGLLTWQGMRGPGRRAVAGWRATSLCPPQPPLPALPSRCCRAVAGGGGGGVAAAAAVVCLACMLALLLALLLPQRRRHRVCMRARPAAAAAAGGCQPACLESCAATCHPLPAAPLPPGCLQRWIISIAAGSPGTGGIVGPSVSLRSAGRATTGCTTSYAAAAACGVSPTARLTAAAGASALWKLEAGPGGTFHILSLVRQAQTMGVAAQLPS